MANTSSDSFRDSRRLRERVASAPPEIPDHEVVRQIGSGSYGSVWLAQSLTGAWRAVKIVRREDFEDERTFNREFEGIQYYEPFARNHPGLVHILHVGRKDGENPFYYYVMELGDDAQAGIHINPADYIPRTLQTDKKLSGDRPMPLDYCLEIGSQLSHALLYLHSKGLTHRDIKPSNVIFVNGRPKLADIGLVAHHGERSFVGTEGFIPPEGPGTQRADVYALAKVLYEITTGKDRRDFPDLPNHLPEGALQKKWLALNNVICSAAEPRLEEAAITNSEQLTEAIDALRGFPVHPRFRFPKRKRKMSSATKVTLAAMTGAICALCVTLWATSLTNRPAPDESLLHARQQDSLVTPADSSVPGTGQGFYIITSNPPRASIYDKNGRYIDETPYGPIVAQAGEHLSFTIKKNGYSTWEESVKIKGGKTTIIGGDLKPYNPPLPGRRWKDATGMAYKPDDLSHISETPISAELFEKFLKTAKLDPDKLKEIPFEEISPSNDTSEKKLALTSPQGIRLYLDWLADECRRKGILSREYNLRAEPVPGFTSEDGKLQAYRLIAAQTIQVPISVQTTPPGASVYFNGKFIGVTPILNKHVEQVPYTLTAKLQGHTPMKRSGQDPHELHLSLQMTPDRSVVYGKDWKNSLGIPLTPLESNILVQIHEVTCKSFNIFLVETKRETSPPPPFFVQEDDHPVVNVTREEAQEFASWLTRRERDLGLIEHFDRYRLPTDEEWSEMAGINEKEGTSPYHRSLESISESPVYYWGYNWPPRKNTGNFADKSALTYLPSNRIITNYEDYSPYTASVGKYQPNSRRLYDIDGNVQEWVDDLYGGGEHFKFSNYCVARGANYLSFRPGHFNPACRTPLPPGTRDPAIGFRLILIRENDPAFHHSDDNDSRKP